MNPNNVLHLSLLAACIFAISSCRKDQGQQSPNPNSAKDYSQSYKYYPTTAGYRWNYEVITNDYNQGTCDTITENARYDSSRMNYYRNGSLWSYSYWSNSYNILGCCGDMVLLYYGDIEDNWDSILIYEKRGKDTFRIYQYRGDAYALDVPSYQTIKCIKTRQLNKYSNGSTLEIIRYFAYGIGLVYSRESESYFGFLKRQETTKLISNQF